MVALKLVLRGDKDNITMNVGFRLPYNRTEERAVFDKTLGEKNDEGK
jgi:hypothetical protein